jgi:hypothetical protein
MKYPLFLSSACLALAASNLAHAQAFELGERTERLPESGELTVQVLRHGGQEFTFIKPSGWSLRLDRANQSLALESPDHGATLTVRISLGESAQSNRTKSEELRRWVQGRVPSGQVGDCHTCYSGNLRGEAVDWRDLQSNGVVTCHRLAVMPFDKGQIEFTLATSLPAEQQAFQEFGTFLTSFNTASTPPASPAVN